MKGYTLLEILFAVVILGFVALGILEVLALAEMSWNTDMGLLDLQQEVRQAMDGMTREVRQSEPGEIDVLNGGSRIDFGIPDVSSNIVSYYPLNGQLIREHPAGNTTVLTNDITSLIFCCVGGASCLDCGNARVLKIQMQASKTVRGRPLSFFMGEQVRFRNE